MTRKHVQVFTKDATECEVNAELLSYTIKDGVISLTVRDEDGTKWSYIFPFWNVPMVRISKL